MESMNPVQRRIHQAALRLFAEKGVSQVNISDLAQEAGVARGTIYNNVETMDKLFEQVASQLSADMHQRVKKSIDSFGDPAQRLANGIRLFIRRTHEEPHWGAFMSRFALSNLALREMFSSQAVPDLIHGLSLGRYQFRQEQMVTVISFIASSVLGSMFLVLEGLKTWREAGTDTAELILRALGVSIEDARVLATVELPPLPPSD
ncbi:TetR/AcrR family transcriptional regulator [Pseudomonas sp. NPDC087814]|uniref:TetR/AcrR family transcriptional regulator n=1 Tax=unclassified Pseudomonas TaxID=196821 RepID=UPI000B3FB6BE|nr:TetR/AcrR family transcriptional regulator [Pseudomonas sp. PE-S1G-1]MBT1265485.1 TetR/AcrR family transcriptional regulator [Pseudomonas sp. VS38]NWC71490.1 TetR/AcrR family transcriptional regulator [Pseudomonas sp. P7758]